jgi:LysR family transcriptional regulator of gallate degradation
VLPINLKHLYFFAEVARLGNVTAAAQNMHLSQPAITQAVANVERFFATPLLNRTPTGVTLTDAGRLCQTRVERTFTHLQTGMGELGKPLALQRKVHLFRSLTTTQVDALLAVVEHRNFSAASRAREVAQPTIYRATRDLERLLEVPLFEKTSYGVVPTRDAERFARKIKLAFAEIAQARAEISSLQGGESGRTVIGALPLARAFILPSALMKFSEQFPHHQIEIVEGTYEHLLSSLRYSEVDMFIGAMRDSKSAPDAIQERLFDDPLSIVMRPGHPLLLKKRITVRMLAGFPWVAPRPSSPLRKQFNRLFKSAGMEPPFATIECNSISAARSLLLESDRIMLLSAHQIHYDLREKILIAIPPPAGKISRPIGMTYRQNWRPTKAQGVLLEKLKECVRDL